MKKIAFYTLGCKTNQYETQQMIESAKNQLEIVNQNEDADIYVINSCTVTQAACDQSRHMLRKLQRQHPHAHIIYTGCDSYLIDKNQYLQSSNVHIVGNKYKTNILSALNLDIDIEPQTKTYNINQTISEWSKSRPFVKIQEGCENFCSYCVVAHTRGKQRFKDKALVLKEIEHFAKNGFGEIVLTGTNLGSYPNLKELLLSIDELKYDFRVRLSSIEPMYVDNELIDIISYGKFAKHLHIPLQSASNKILQFARRQYTRQDYEKIVNYASKKGIFLGTDIIVGLNETHEDFLETYNFIENNDITFAHIFTYSYRQFTKPPEISTPLYTLKDRANKLKQLINKKFRHKLSQFIGKKTQIVIQHKSAKASDDTFFIAIASQYFKVLTKTYTNGLIEGKIVQFDGTYAYFER